MENKDLQYLKLFKLVCKKINSSLDIAEVLNSITENAVSILSVKGCAIYLLDTKEKRLRVRAYSGLSEAYIGKGPLDAEKSIEESLEGNWVMVSDATADSRIQYPEEAKKEGVVSILSVPISVKERIIGVLRIYTSKLQEFSEADNEFISGLAEIGGIGIENARMYHHLKAEYESLISDVHDRYYFGRAS